MEDIDNMEDIDVLIIKYLDNHADASEKKALNDWINISNDNERYFVHMAQIWELSFINLQDSSYAEERFARFQQLLHKQKTRRINLIISSVAAVVLLFFVIQLLTPSFGNDLLSVTTLGEKKKIELSDGSVVWLNKFSSLQYSEKFFQDRTVRLTGEAYFEVVTDREHPFFVRTNNLTIKVLGTKFVVTDYEDDKFAETVLQSGSIHLKTEKSAKEFLLVPGQKMTYDIESGDTQLELVDAHHFSDWTNNRLLFENTKLKDVFIQLEKWYGIKIESTDTELLQTPVSFTLDKEPLSEILFLLQQITNFNWSEKENIIIIE